MQSWGGWSSGWSVNSFLSTASALTNQVSQGLTNVIDASIGAPAPETLVSINKDEKNNVVSGNGKQPFEF